MNKTQRIYQQNLNPYKVSRQSKNKSPISKYVNKINIGAQLEDIKEDQLREQQVTDRGGQNVQGQGSQGRQAEQRSFAKESEDAKAATYEDLQRIEKKIDLLMNYQQFGRQPNVYELPKRPERMKTAGNESQDDQNWKPDSRQLVKTFEPSFKNGKSRIKENKELQSIGQYLKNQRKEVINDNYYDSKIRNLKKMYNMQIRGGSNQELGNKTSQHKKNRTSLDGANAKFFTERGVNKKRQSHSRGPNEYLLTAKAPQLLPLQNDTNKIYLQSILPKNQSGKKKGKKELMLPPKINYKKNREETSDPGLPPVSREPQRKQSLMLRPLNSSPADLQNTQFGLSDGFEAKKYRPQLEEIKPQSKAYLNQLKTQKVYKNAVGPIAFPSQYKKKPPKIKKEQQNVRVEQVIDKINVRIENLNANLQNYEQNIDFTIKEIPKDMKSTSRQQNLDTDRQYSKQLSYNGLPDNLSEETLKTILDLRTDRQGQDCPEIAQNNLYLSERRAPNELNDDVLVKSQVIENTYDLSLTNNQIRNLTQNSIGGGKTAENNSGRVQRTNFQEYVQQRGINNMSSELQNCTVPQSPDFQKIDNVFYPTNTQSRISQNSSIIDK